LAYFVLAHVLVDTRLIATALFHEISELGGSGGLSLNEIQQIAGKVAKGAFGPHLNRVADLIPSASSTIADEEKSVTREIEHVRAYAERKGWTVAEEHVYADDGISGAEFLKRPDFLRLMNALKPRPGFQVLMMSEVSRLGREQIETAYAMKQITEAGVAV
jgi:hypothetical protein